MKGSAQRLDVPNSGSRTEDGDLVVTVVVKVGRLRNVRGLPERYHPQGAVDGAKDVPRSRRRPEHGQVALAVGVVIRRNRPVAGEPELAVGIGCVVERMAEVPDTIRRTKNRRFVGPVTVKVRDQRYIAVLPELIADSL